MRDNERERETKMENKLELTDVEQVLELIDFKKIESKLDEIVDIINENKASFRYFNVSDRKRTLLASIISYAKSTGIGAIKVNAVKNIRNRKSYRIRKELRNKVYMKLNEMYKKEIKYIRML